jgi:hypothetical protein
VSFTLTIWLRRRAIGSEKSKGDGHETDHIRDAIQGKCGTEAR